MLVATVVLTTPASADQTTPTTFGADLSQPPNVTFDCTKFPELGGPVAVTLVPDPSCTWATDTGGPTPSVSMITPAGTGTITAVRLRVGPTTGAMALVILQLEENATTAAVSCCTALFVGPSFTPTANAVTTLNVNIPVHTDGPGEQSSPGLQVGDILGLSILEDGVPIPALDETGSGVPVSGQPTGTVTYPAYTQGQTAQDFGGTVGYVLDMQADWTPSAATPLPPPPNNPTPPGNLTPTSVTPTLKFATGTPTVKGKDVDVKLGCGAGAACNGTLEIENQPLAGAAKAKSKKPKTIVYAKGSFKLAAGATKSISTPLTSSGKSAAKSHKKIKVYVNATYGSGKTAKKISHHVTITF